MKIMNKEKLKHLPVNLFIYSTSWIIPFLFITTAFTVDIWIAVYISFYFYFNDVIHACDIDYLNEKIKKISDLNNK
jgi:hypothetical protein